LDTLQPALACPPPRTDAETHFKVMADAGTVVHPLELGELAPTIKVQVCPLLPCVIFQLIVATDPLGTVPPGLFARNGIVLGAAFSSPTAVKPIIGVFWLADGTARMGWLLFVIGF
jgi:hypothetical protein